MTIDYQTLEPPKDWCFGFVWTNTTYNISRPVKKFTVYRTASRSDAIAKLREFFAPDEVTDIHLHTVQISKNLS